MHKVNTIEEPSPNGGVEIEGANKKESRQGAPHSADGMKLHHFLLVALVISISVIIYITYRSIYSYRTEPTLVKAFVGFRHGSRAPKPPYVDDKFCVYNLTIWPGGPGQLTEKGKQEAFVLGKRLRERYGDFLGDAYNPAEVRVYSTLMKRTFATAELALAGLFPLHYQQDNGELSSRAILPQSDYIFNARSGTECPAFAVEAKKLFEEMLSKMTYEENTTVSMALKHAENRSGQLDLTIFYEVWDALYFQEREGLQLPAWTNDIYPEKMTSIIVKFILAYVNGTALQKKLILYKYAAAVRNFLLSKDGSKMEIHSWHDNNQIAIMNTFDISIDFIPAPTSCVVIEMHNRSGQMFFEVYYYESYKSREPRQMEMPCGYSCPIEELDNIVNKYRLEDYTEACQSGEEDEYTFQSVIL